MCNCQEMVSALITKPQHSNVESLEHFYMFLLSNVSTGDLSLKVSSKNSMVCVIWLL